MKSRTKQSSMKRVNNQSSFTATCKPSDTGTSHQLLHRTFWQHLSIVLFLLLSMGVGFGTATAQAQTRAYVANFGSNTVSVIDIATNTVVATIPVGVAPSGIAITRVPQAPTRRGRRCVSGQEWASWFAQTARTPSTATGIARSVVVIGTRTR